VLSVAQFVAGGDGAVRQGRDPFAVVGVAGLGVVPDEDRLSERDHGRHR